MTAITHKHQNKKTQKRASQLLLHRGASFFFLSSLYEAQAEVDLQKIVA